MSDHLMELSRELPPYEVLPDNKQTNGLKSSIVIAGAHKLYGFTVNNTNGAAQFVLLFDQTSLPANGAVPVCSFTAPASSDKGVLWIPARKMLAGIVLANSSTAGSLTIGAADCFFDVQFAN